MQPCTNMKCFIYFSLCLAPAFSITIPLFKLTMSTLNVLGWIYFTLYQVNLLIILMISINRYFAIVTSGSGNQKDHFTPRKIATYIVLSAFFSIGNTLNGKYHVGVSSNRKK